MFFQESIEILLRDACPSIKYRIRKEILKESILSADMQSLYSQILQEQTVKEVIKRQQKDGWFGTTFHGEKGMEASIRLLCEKGVEPSHPAIVKALGALRASDKNFARELYNVGKILDRKGLGGSNPISPNGRHTRGLL